MLDTIFKADTLEELADQIGVPLPSSSGAWTSTTRARPKGLTLSSTAARSAHLGLALSIPSPPWSQGPFYAVAISAGCLGSVGGPRLNGNA